jgi:hypothetical protein
LQVAFHLFRGRSWLFAAVGGPAVTQRYGATILGALGVAGAGGSQAERTATEQALEDWRSAVAKEMGVPTYVVLGDRAWPSSPPAPRAIPRTPRREPAPASVPSSMPSCGACCGG